MSDAPVTRDELALVCDVLDIMLTHPALNIESFVRSELSPRAQDRLGEYAAMRESWR